MSKIRTLFEALAGLDGLEEHPFVRDPWNLNDPEAASFHEAVCSAARHMAKHPEHYADLPDTVRALLHNVNLAVARLAIEINPEDL